MTNVNRTTRTFRAILGALAVTALMAGTLSADDGKNNNNTEVRLRTALAGGAIAGKTPTGNADFRSESSKNRTRLNVEVENVNLPDGTMLTVSVTHMGVTTMVGSITLRSGFGELELDSQDGDTVPAIAKGDMIAVSQGATGILSGTF